MKIDLKLKMDKKTFVFCIVIIVLLVIVSLNWNDTPILIERYNCSCPEKESSFFNDLEWKEFGIINQSIGDNYDLPNFEYCEEVTCDCYGEFGCMARCYKC